uniref:PH domain-containing protein n=1 Tax=Mola mola TaxID=94237 RepID=A0A3Q3W9S9_MOLML
MEAGEQHSSNINLKRQRAPLSDSEDNVFLRRFEAADQENRSPKPSSSGCHPALEKKPDTPIVPSVRSRVQQLTQRQDGEVPLAQRCLSDPGAESPSVFPAKGQGEFQHRVERFKVPLVQASPAPSQTPTNQSPRTCSNFVSGIQQKLQGITTPSSQQASRIREELSRLQSISENAWMKRSNSDPSLNQVGLCSRYFMFGEVLEYAGMIEDERVENDEDIDHDSGIGACSGDKDKIRMESEKEKSEVECDERKTLESNGDELLTFPPSGILSPLSKSVEAVVTPLVRMIHNIELPIHDLILDCSVTDSVDAYRTQRQSKNPTIQSVTPGVQRRAPQKSQPQPSVNTKEKIMALNEEAGKLQNVINQTLQALSCCTDEDHGRGSLEEAEAEKLLLVSCEKRSALLTEVTRLKEEVSSESEGAIGEDRDNASQQPCRGTVSITNIQLPLKLEFVCCSHNRPGRPSHYFFVLIRYGPCNIVATPLATAADVQNGDTISFPTSVTLKDIRSSFEIDVEVYSLFSSVMTFHFVLLCPSAAAPPALSGRRSSNFCLVGSHKITLASLGNSKFPLDKMKLEGKIRRLLGDEFQEKVPFLSPLEGHIYLQLDSQGHSDLQHQGFLTMFELISGFGVWHRRYFVLEGCIMHYWNHPNDRETKAAEGSICLSSSPSQSVRPVERDLCARPFTFELVSNTPQQQQDKSQDTLAKCWFSADTKQERLDWMEKLGQALLDFHTWTQTSATQADSQQSNTSSSGNLRESIL